jgi:nicotinamide riboside kinase
LAVQAQSRYDLVIVCDSDIPYDDTWDRSGDTDRQVFQKQIVADLRVRRQPFLLVRGDVDSRVRQISELLARHQKYGNLLETLSASQ